VRHFQTIKGCVRRCCPSRESSRLPVLFGFIIQSHFLEKTIIAYEIIACHSIINNAILVT